MRSTLTRTFLSGGPQKIEMKNEVICGSWRNLIFLIECCSEPVVSWRSPHHSTDVFLTTWSSKRPVARSTRHSSISSCLLSLRILDILHGLYSKALKEHDLNRRRKQKTRLYSRIEVKTRQRAARKVSAVCHSGLQCGGTFGEAFGAVAFTIAGVVVGQLASTGGNRKKYWLDSVVAHALANAVDMIAVVRPSFSVPNMITM